MNLSGPQDLPESIQDEDQLDEVLTRPRAPLVESIRTISSPLLILGAGGKMGPTLAVLAKRAAEAACHPLEVIAVSRFSDGGVRAWIERHGVKTVCCDLLRAAAVEELPGAGAIAYLVGRKFGSVEDPAATWAANTLVPAWVAERYGQTPIVALSTGNVYPLTEVGRGGSLEAEPLIPLGEYANAAVGRERIFEFYSRARRTPVTLLRLFYAVELRYGVLVDIARKVQAGEPIDLATGYFNCIWQGDANEVVLRALSLAACPPSVWNLCRPEICSVRAVAARFGELLDRAPRWSGREALTALLGNAGRLCAKLGEPSVPLETMLRLVAHWVKRGGRHLGKPTHFEVRDGNY
jgi:nucleoside-diphosphate-sugar epimerase